MSPNIVCKNICMPNPIRQNIPLNQQLTVTIPTPNLVTIMPEPILMTVPDPVTAASTLTIPTQSVIHQQSEIHQQSVTISPISEEDLPTLHFSRPTTPLLSSSDPVTPSRGLDQSLLMTPLNTISPNFVRTPSPNLGPSVSDQNVQHSPNFQPDPNFRQHLGQMRRLRILAARSRNKIRRFFRNHNSLSKPIILKNRIPNLDRLFFLLMQYVRCLWQVATTEFPKI